jgi:DNA-binding FrmR family transcriptional regulator
MGYTLGRMKPELQGQARRRLRKINGQVAGLERMVDEDRYCVDVLLQIAAVRGALDQLGKLLLEGHIETCVADAIRSGRTRERDEKLAELIEVFSRFAHIGGR